MRPNRSLSFDGLETRQLMTAGHHAAPKVPIELDGTLAVNQKAATETDDAFGDLMKLTPVAGTLAGVGKVHGTWTEGMTSSGTPMVSDTIQLQNARGSIVVSFATTHLGQAQPTATGEVFAAVAQHLTGGTKAYAHATETGSIVVNTTAKTVVSSMTLSSDAG